MSTADSSGPQPESQAQPENNTGDVGEVAEQRHSGPSLRRRMGRKAAEGIGEAAGRSLAEHALEWVLGQL